jgi:integrase
MTFAELLTMLEGRNALPASRVKDLKTSLRYLAAALGYQGLDDATVDDACRDPLRWTAALDARYRHLEAQGRVISVVSRRNNGSNLRLVFRVAGEQGLLAAPLPQPLLTKPRRVDFQRAQRATAPYQSTYHPQGPRRYGLPKAEWPAHVRAEWDAYLAHSEWRLRQTTFATYEKAMATYLGFLLGVEGRTITWDDLFQVETLQAFLRWHGARLGRPLSVHGKQVVIMIAAIAVTQDHPNRRALADFRNNLPTPTAMHNKDSHMVSLARLDEIAEACLAEGRGPFQTTKRIRTPGLYRTLQFQRGLILKLLRYIPIRQRNIREMKRGQNLYEAQGHWHLLFRGAELKIAKKRGKPTNEYYLDLDKYAAPFVPPLREFLQTYRPRIPGADTSPFLFLTWHGTPFTQRGLGEEVSCEVARRTGGTRFYPHLVRTMWATEYLRAYPGDYRTVAIMLGDDIATVQRTYEHVDEALHRAKAADFNNAVPTRG